MPQATQAPQAPQMDSAAARRAYAQDLIDEAHRLAEAKTNLFARRSANRQALRQMHIQGHLNAEQRKLFEEVYPPRQVAEENAA